MPPVDPSAYAWISRSDLDVAGCVTVVPEADPAAVARAFGHDLDLVGEVDTATFAECRERGTLGDDGSQIWVGGTARATTVYEFNGFEGSRTEVLRDASKLGSKVAASLFWNVNGMMIVTCARRGKVVASVELPLFDEADLAEVPRALRRLAASTIDEEADLLAIGAAMVETYAGVGFTEADLTGSSVLSIVARPDDLATHVPGRGDYGPFDRSIPGIQESLDALPPERQRALAEWAAAAAVREARLDQEPAVLEVLAQFGSASGTTLPPGIAILKRGFATEAERLRKEHHDEYDEASFDAIWENHSWLPGHALEAVRYTSHPDPYSAMIGALQGAASTFSCARFDRGARFVINERGRQRARDGAVTSHLAAFADVVRQVLEADPTDWPDLAQSLPAPPTSAELAEASERDQRLQRAGAFSTWGVFGAWEPGSDPGPDDREAERRHAEEVMARYQKLEIRDRERAARGPIAVEVLEPENPGGFAVQLSDGLRIERLPAGRAAGRLWLTFVFTGVDFDGDSGRRDARPSARITYTGPHGPFMTMSGGGSGRDSTYQWSTDIDTTDLPWLRLSYLDAGKVAASETIDLS